MMAQCWTQTAHQIALQDASTSASCRKKWPRVSRAAFERWVPSLHKGSKQRQAFLISWFWVIPFPEKKTAQSQSCFPTSLRSRHVLRGVVTLWSGAETHRINEPFPLERQKPWLQGTQYFSNFSSLNTFRSTEFRQTATWVNPFISKTGRQKTQRGDAVWPKSTQLMHASHH